MNTSVLIISPNFVDLLLAEASFLSFCWKRIEPKDIFQPPPPWAQTRTLNTKRVVHPGTANRFADVRIRFSKTCSGSHGRNALSDIPEFRHSSRIDVVA